METLIPRPDTESVVDLALERIDLRGGSCRVLDIGTGSGAIAISIAQERPLCDVHATDVSEDALEIARRNAERNGVTVHFHRADVASGLQFLKGPWTSWSRTRPTWMRSPPSGGSLPRCAGGTCPPLVQRL